MSANLVSKVRDNSWLFLRRAINELISHDDTNDEGLNKERAIIALTLIQMSFELSLVAYFIKVDGIHGIVNDVDATLTEERLLSKFANNELMTKPFNSLKTIALSRNIFLNSDDEYLINEFQKVRNKLVHLNYNFHQSDLYDLKYDLTYFIVKVVIPTLTGDEFKPSQAIAENIDSKDFLKLVKFPPYASEMSKLARENAEHVYRCIVCGNDSLATSYGDEHCYSCCEDFSEAGFIDCPCCKSKCSLIYDALNIKSQSDWTVRGICLKCGTDDIIYLCEKCGSEVALEATIGEGKCCLDFCQWDERNT